MRIRIPRRFLLLGILLCSLALASSVPQPTFAKPIPWTGDQDPTLGDGDGPVVKGGNGSGSASFAITTTTTTARTTKAVTTSNRWMVYLTALRLGYWWRGIW